MMKLTVGFALLILGLCISVQAQAPEPDLRYICRRQNQRCESRENINGRSNEVTNMFNNHCRRSNRNWRNVTRCELARANCQLTLVRCSTLTCENVRRTLGGGGGRVTTPRIPTPPTDDPSPNPEPTRNIPGTRAPRTTRRSRTTTRRTPTTRRGGRTTRRGGRTTTRRTPTTRRGGRTTRRGGRTTTRRTPTTRRGGRTTTRRTPTTRRPGRTPRPPREPID